MIDFRIEVAANLPGVVAVRDSKDRTGPVLIFGHADWHTFTASCAVAHRTCAEPS